MHLHVALTCRLPETAMVLRGVNIYWVYELLNWLFGSLTIAITEAIGLGGLYATRKWVRRIHGTEHSHNEVVGFY